MAYAPSKIQLTSSAFTDGGAIPSRHTGESDDVSPALSWTPGESTTKSYAIICHDPDAPRIDTNGTYGFVHWVLYNIPTSVTSLAEGETGYTSGPNDFGNDGYGGPMPPVGHGDHRYYFWVLEIDIETNLEPGINMWDFLKQLEPNITGMSRLVGTYQRN